MGEETPTPRETSPRAIIHVVTLGLTVAASAIALLAPVFPGEDGTVSLLAATGPTAILLVLAPVAVALMPVLLRPAGPVLTIAVAVLLNIWALLASGGIGMVYMPAGVGAIAAIFAPPVHRSRPRTRNDEA